MLFLTCVEKTVARISKIALTTALSFVLSFSQKSFVYSGENNTVIVSEKPTKNSLFKFSTHRYQHQSFDVLSLSPSFRNNVRFFFKDLEGESYATISTLNESLQKENKTLLFAMNGGIFSKEQEPLGLYIENGKVLFPVNRKRGQGNFYLKPNGIFFIDNKGFHIQSTADFKLSKKIRYAIQSGPLLLNDGHIHPQFNPQSKSLRYRNAVGVDAKGVVHFVISNEPVTFFVLSKFFQDVLQCQDALYLDGTISQMHVKQKRKYRDEKFSVMIGVVE